MFTRNICINLNIKVSWLKFLHFLKILYIKKSLQDFCLHYCLMEIMYTIYMSLISIKLHN